MIFLDYLDKHLAKNTLNAEDNLACRLKFDLLTFFDKQLFIAAPALAKSDVSLELAVTQCHFSNSMMIRPVLPPDAMRSMQTYIDKRLYKLSSSMNEEIFLRSVETRGYMKGNWRIFFAENNPKSPIYERTSSADILFRKFVAKDASNEGFRSFGSKHLGGYTGIFDYLVKYSEDSSAFFQRETILSNLQSKYHFPHEGRAYIKNMLDANFDRANASAIGAIPSSNYFGFGGLDLMKISKILPIKRLKYKNLYECIYNMPINSVIALSNDIDWICFVKRLRAIYEQTNNFLFFDKNNVFKENCTSKKLDIIYNILLLFFRK